MILERLFPRLRKRRLRREHQRYLRATGFTVVDWVPGWEGDLVNYPVFDRLEQFERYRDELPRLAQAHAAVETVLVWR